MSEAGQKAERSPLRTLGSWVKEIVIILVLALLASLLLRLFVVQMFKIPSESMENTLLVQDRVAAQKVAGFQRGDVVVFEDKAKWLPTPPDELSLWQQAIALLGFAPDTSKNYLVKRVIGMPGDHVTCCDEQGRISVNEVPLDERSYLYTDPGTSQQTQPSDVLFDLVVPKDRIFVMGDHRDMSSDSRYNMCGRPGGEPAGLSGFIPVANVVGSGVAVIYPFDRIHLVSRPAIFDAVPDPGTDPPDAPIINLWPETC